MRIMFNNFNPVNFGARIIDAHGHIGQFYGDDFDSKVDEFVKQKLDDDDVIEKMVISNVNCMGNSSDMPDEYEGNLVTLKKAESDNHYIPLAVCEVGVGSADEIKRLFKDNPDKFKGLKFHPDCASIMADAPEYLDYLKFAQEEKLPCVFHCAINWDNGRLVDEKYRYSNPEAIYEAAKKVPDAPVVMAHMGGGGEIVHQIALDALINSIENEDATLYADISWVDCDNPKRPNLIKAIKALQNTSKGDMTERLLWGSDAPIGENLHGKNGLSGLEYYRKGISDTKQAIRDNFEPDTAEDLINKIFYENANKLFCSDCEN